MSEPARRFETAPAPGRGRIYNSITETIGDTPLVRLDFAERYLSTALFEGLED